MPGLGGSTGGTVNHNTTDRRPGLSRYEIRLDGHLGPRWVASFEPMTVTTHGDGTTSLSGTVVDQAALHGLLTRLRDLGLPLLSLSELRSDLQPPTQTVHSGPDNTRQGD